MIFPIAEGLRGAGRRRGRGVPGASLDRGLCRLLLLLVLRLSLEGVEEEGGGAESDEEVAGPAMTDAARKSPCQRLIVYHLHCPFHCIVNCNHKTSHTTPHCCTHPLARYSTNTLPNEDRQTRVSGGLQPAVTSACPAAKTLLWALKPSINKARLANEKGLPPSGAPFSLWRCFRN